MASLLRMRKPNPETEVKADPTNIRLPDVYPPLAEKIARLADIQQRRGELEKERTQVIRARMNLSSTIKTTDGRQDRVAALVAGSESTRHTDVQSLGERLSELTELLDDLAEAEDQLRVAVAADKSRASALLAAGELGDHHRQLAREMLLGFVAAHSAFTKYDAFLDDLRERDVSLTLFNPCWFGQQMFSNPHNREEAIGYALREAAHQGLIDASDVPENLR
jgi:hypothetical protein